MRATCHLWTVVTKFCCSNMLKIVVKKSNCVTSPLHDRLTLWRFSCLQKFPATEGMTSRTFGSFECLWFWLRPRRLSRSLTGLICGVVYCPPNTPAQEENDLVAYIIDTLDVVRSRRPDCGVVILGDFNTLNVADVFVHHNLKQVVILIQLGAIMF